MATKTKPGVRRAQPSRKNSIIVVGTMTVPERERLHNSALIDEIAAKAKVYVRIGENGKRIRVKRKRVA